MGVSSIGTTSLQTIRSLMEKGVAYMNKYQYIADSFDSTGDGVMNRLLIFIRRRLWNLILTS